MLFTKDFWCRQQANSDLRRAGLAGWWWQGHLRQAWTLLPISSNHGRPQSPTLWGRGCLRSPWQCLASWGMLLRRGAAFSSLYKTKEREETTLQLVVLVGRMCSELSVAGTKTRKTVEIQTSTEKKGAVRAVGKERSCWMSCFSLFKSVGSQMLSNSP